MTGEVKYNLLIIDKSGLTSDELNGLTLSQEGFEVVALSDYHEALSRLGELMPDLIIIGEELAVDSFDACRQLCQAVTIPILMLGTIPRGRGWVRAINAGADLYLTKPVGLKELVARMKAILRRREWACVEG